MKRSEALISVAFVFDEEYAFIAEAK